jgi:hypothetical protein
MEEAAIVLFESFPDNFLLFGGATLILFHGSPRLSADLDLLSRKEKLPSAAELRAAVEERITQVTQAFGLGNPAFEVATDSKQLVKVLVTGARGQRLFSVDLSRIGGSVIGSEIVQERISNERKTLAIPTPTRNYLLLQKAETFLTRRTVKARDAFDICHLLTAGAVLDGTLKVHLNDTLMWREVNKDGIGEKIEQINAKLCRAELKPVLPAAVYTRLEAADFRSLREALRRLFAPWL